MGVEASGFGGLRVEGLGFRGPGGGLQGLVVEVEVFRVEGLRVEGLRVYVRLCLRGFEGFGA